MKKDEALNILETFVTDEQLARLKGVSEMTGAPISTLIQIAVAEYLKNLPKSLTPQSESKKSLLTGILNLGN